MIRYCILLLALSALNLRAQDWGQINQLTNDADYFYMTKQYDKAIKSYALILKQLPDNANVKYKIGVCYLNTDNEKEKSVQYLSEATSNISPQYNPSSSKEDGAPIETYFLLGSAYRVTNQLDKAIDAYNNYLINLKLQDTREKQITEQYIKACYHAIEKMNNPAAVKVTNLGNLINDDSPNFNAVISGDGNTLVYTSNKNDMNIIMMSDKVNGAWIKPKAITRQMTSKNNFKCTGISFDGTILYLVEDDPFNSEIYVSTLTKGKWSGAVKLKKPINTKMNETHASLSPDGKTLYFTSDRPGGSGDMDIYFSTIDEKGIWGKPVNMGPKINTVFNEETPFISPDGKRLYFSSEGHTGMGGYDIFYFDLNETGSVPVNLGYPINTTDNDLFFVPGNNIYEGHYARVENDGFGAKDISFVELQPMIEITEKVITDNNLIFIDTIVYEPPVPAADELPAIAVAEPTITPDSKTPLPDDESFTAETVKDQLPDKPLAVSTHEVVADYALQTFIDEVIDEMNDISAIPPGTPVTYTVQLYALRKPVDPGYFRNLENITVHLAADNFYKYTWGIANDLAGAKKLKDDARSHGYRDVIIRRRAIVPAYTIQLMAGKDPVDFRYFNQLDRLKVELGKDGYYRYCYGEYSNEYDATNQITRLKELGYKNAFLRRL